MHALIEEVRRLGEAAEDAVRACRDVACANDHTSEIVAVVKRVAAALERLGAAVRADATDEMLHVAHQMNNLFTGVISLAVVSAEDAEDGECKANLHEIEVGGHRCAALIRRMVRRSEPTD